MPEEDRKSGRDWHEIAKEICKEKDVTRLLQSCGGMTDASENDKPLTAKLSEY